MASSKKTLIIYPLNEHERVRLLRSLKILDTSPEARFDDLVTLAAQVAGVEKAALSLIDEDRQWFKARTAPVKITGTSREDSFCTHTILKPKNSVFVIEDASKSSLLRKNPLVTADGGVRFYAGVPLILFETYAVGSLCVFDSVARTLTASQQEALVKIANVAVRRLEELSPELRSNALRSFLLAPDPKIKKTKG